MRRSRRQAMTEVLRYVLTWVVASSAVVAVRGENVTDSVAAAITVYRNPEFFKNLTKRTEKEREEEVNGNFNSDYFDFSEGQPEEPKRPNPPDFDTYYNKFRTKEEEKSDSGDEVGGSAKVDVAEEGNELQDGATDAESTAEEVPATTTENKFHVVLDEDLYPRTSAKIYDESREYFNPVFDQGFKSYSYPASYEDLDYYAYSKSSEEKERRKRKKTTDPEAYHVDHRRGVREYVLVEGVGEPRSRPPKHSHSFSAGSRHTFKTRSTLGLPAPNPVIFLPIPPYAAKVRYVIRPKTHVKIRIARSAPSL